MDELNDECKEEELKWTEIALQRLLAWQMLLKSKKKNV